MQSSDGAQNTNLNDINEQGQHAGVASNGFGPLLSSYAPHGEQAQGEVQAYDSAHHDPLTVQTMNLGGSHAQAPLSSTTDFEYDESPVLGMPGSFMMTPPQDNPPILPKQETRQEPQPTPPAIPEGELLQPRAFQPLKEVRTSASFISEDPDTMQSELGVRESIPIMLGADEPLDQGEEAPRHSPLLTLDARKWRAEPLDDTGTISYLEEDESPPINPFANRETLRPDDSASVAFYRNIEQRSPDCTPKMPSMPESGGMTLDSEAYSVINKVLNMYHRSPEITPELAYEARKKVQAVSPVIAQHKDWGSKESTETYLARLLSDANSAEQRGVNDGASEPQAVRDDTSRGMPALSYHELDEDPAEAHTGGTAIIFPPESRRYSRGSHGSTATTIWDETSRADSSSVRQPRDRSPDEPAQGQQRLYPTTFVPHPLHRTSPASQREGQAPRESHQSAGASFGDLLPQIEGAGEGLGLSLQSSQHDQPRPQGKQPPRPSGPPPPLPSPHTPASTQPYTPSVYSQHPSSSGTPSAPAVARKARINAAMGNQPGAPAPRDHDHAGKGEGGFQWVDGRDASEAGDGASQHSVPSVHVSFESRTARSSQTAAASLADGVQDLTLNDATASANASGTTFTNGKTEDAPLSGAASADQKASGKESSTAITKHGAAFPGEDEEAITRRLHRRYRIIEELVKTENDYMCDLMVIVQIWLGTAREAFPEVHVRNKVFCNIADLADLDQQLVVDLKASFEPIAWWRHTNSHPYAMLAAMMQDKEYEGCVEPEVPFENCTLENDNLTSVGYVIKGYLHLIGPLYTKYLLNHSKATQIIAARQDEEDEVFIGWQKACYLGSKDLTDAWDLDSLLVKPVQRLMKYPLLLQSLKEVTPPTHGDYEDIETALKGIVEINYKINDLRKRHETLRQATKEGKKEKKKGFLGGDILKALTSKDKVRADGSQWFSDPDYDKITQKFGGHVFQITVINRDFDHYRDELTTCFLHLNIVAVSMCGILEDQTSSSPEIESRWRKDAMALLELRNVLLEDHVSCLFSPDDMLLTPRAERGDQEEGPGAAHAALCPLCQTSETHGTAQEGSGEVHQVQADARTRRDGRQGAR
jgi:hypothetical protein